MIYFVQGDLTRLIKVGKAVDCESRLKNLQCGSPDKLRIIKQIYVNDDTEVEYLIHARFDFCRRHGEWFSPNEKFLEFIDSLSLNCRAFDMAQQLDKMGVRLDIKVAKKQGKKLDRLNSVSEIKDYQAFPDWRAERVLRQDVAAFRNALESRGIKTTRRKTVAK